MSLERVWQTEFGESLENLQSHSKLIPLFQRKNKIVKKTYEFGESEESPNPLQTQSSCPKKNINRKENDNGKNENI